MSSFVYLGILFRKSQHRTGQMSVKISLFIHSFSSFSHTNPPTVLSLCIHKYIHFLIENVEKLHIKTIFKWSVTKILLILNNSALFGRVNVYIMNAHSQWYGTMQQTKVVMNHLVVYFPKEIWFIHFSFTPHFSIGHLCHCADAVWMLSSLLIKDCSGACLQDIFISKSWLSGC